MIVRTYRTHPQLASLLMHRCSWVRHFLKRPLHHHPDEIEFDEEVRKDRIQVISTDTNSYLWAGKRRANLP